MTSRRPRSRSLVLALPLALLASCDSGTTTCPEPQPVAETPVSQAPKPAYDYPAARVSAQVDELHGVAVPDPYRWMESIDSEETRAWVEAENAVTFGYLETIESRGAIAKHLEELWNYERYGTPWVKGGRYFFTRNDGLQNQSVYYYADSLDGEPKVVLDPNALNAEGTTAVSGFAVSDDGEHVIYGLSDAGSDWKRWKVREVETGEDLPDLIEWSKFTGVSWSPDNEGFFYGAYDPPKAGDEYEQVNKSPKLYYHRLGQKQRQDALIYADASQPDWQFDGGVSEDGKYLLIDVSAGTDVRTMFYYAKLPKKLTGKKPIAESAVVKLIPELDATYAFIANVGSKFYFFTNKDAPKGKVIEIDVDAFEKARAKDPKARFTARDVIPETEHTLASANYTGGKLFAKYMVDAKHEVRVHGLDGKLESTLTLPESIATVYGFGGKGDPKKTKETFYGLMGFTRPYTIYRYDIATGKSELWREPKLAFDPSRYETKQVFYTSKDGTRVPMFLVHKKGLQPSGSTPTYLYAYGGFNISLTPRFSVPDLVWLEMGGLYAQPNLRGGGEYGEEWHVAGTKLDKQNVFDDFIAAAEYLVDEGWTSAPHLAIGGRSNGGLLVGATMTQRPDLFGAALAGVGVMDMLRFHEFTIGWAWVSDYGSADDPEEFAALHAYSPYHNIKAGTEYPATLVYTADHDDRVVPSHSYKFAAQLQANHVGEKPVMIRIDTDAGHGAGKPTAKQIEEWADLWGFLQAQLDFQLPEGF
ncbi:prolyl endopeptidase [Plesiocystis pacifica SIR-1]|uniref:prolyl oligopeptidase n=1 Tax=Plesiocystis pacifica SIR-1 TaxID=391625 RepID=A6G133_9BACT|nr:prolyl oligopeptidase family serine peptidase [Plesiocystis pacifica]EDM80328.1 prolyl endopeptidase [Plesiocystis pacifica SIR-1]